MDMYKKWLINYINDYTEEELTINCYILPSHEGYWTFRTPRIRNALTVSWTKQYFPPAPEKGEPLTPSPKLFQIPVKIERQHTVTIVRRIAVLGALAAITIVSKTFNIFTICCRLYYLRDTYM